MQLPSCDWTLAKKIFRYIPPIITPLIPRCLSFLLASLGGPSLQTFSLYLENVPLSCGFSGFTIATAAPRSVDVASESWGGGGDPAWIEMIGQGQPVLFGYWILHGPSLVTLL